MTKKEQAFVLFSEGRTTSSAEVKALKLKSRTRYNYYLEWQKGGGVTPSSLSSVEAKGSGGRQLTPFRSSLPSVEARENQEEAEEKSVEAREEQE